jgi:hypothetical protein
MNDARPLDSGYHLRSSLSQVRGDFHWAFAFIRQHEPVPRYSFAPHCPPIKQTLFTVTRPQGARAIIVEEISRVLYIRSVSCVSVSGIIACLLEVTPGSQSHPSQLLEFLHAFGLFDTFLDGRSELSLVRQESLSWL